MFALFHADEMPLLEWGDVTVERIAGNTYRVKAEIRNTRAIPTRIEAAELYGSGLPDYSASAAAACACRPAASRAAS
jgi:hypothetical protein